MKARVNTYLNIRTGSPEVLPDNNPNDLYYSPGAVIEIAEIVEGENYKDNNKWYRLIDGVFVWSGGLNKPYGEVGGLGGKSFASTTDFPVFEAGKISWAHSALRITEIWKDAGVSGEKVRVTILDEGFDNHHDDLRTIKVKEFSTSIDQIEHGTEMLGIIGAKGIKVYGVAPESQMFFAKVDFGNTESIVQALQWARMINSDIISLSFKCRFDEKIEDELKKCFNQNIAIVASIGDSGQLNIPKEVYPASSPFCLAIGCFGKDFKRIDVSNISDKLKIMAPAESILTAKAGNSSYEDNGATSLATAFTSGTLALLLSVARNTEINITAKDVFDMLCRNADKRNNENQDFTNRYGFGLLEPYRTYNLIKEMQ